MKDNVKRDLTTWQCPSCGYQTKQQYSRSCSECDYRGDWVQPGETLTYAEQKELDRLLALWYAQVRVAK